MTQSLEISPFIKQSFRGRCVFCFITIIPAITIFYYLQVTPFLYAIFIAQGLVWPYVALQIAKRSKNPKKTDILINYNLDLLLWGFWIPLCEFNPIIILYFFVGAGAAGLSVNGFKLFFSRLILGIIGSIIGGFIFGFHYNYVINLPIIITCSIGILSITYVSAYLSYLAGKFISSARKQLKEQKNQIEKEKHRSESLLHNILPEIIADRLKIEPNVIADAFEQISILFVDICNFTPISEKETPETIVSYLNEIFSFYDDLVEKYEVEKIKTIGDAYMAAAGIPTPRSDHAEVLADLALEMVERIKDFPFYNGKDLNVRIGINSGPAVAGVIGKKKFAYDLWGDTVNIASRMESHGVPGEIQVSEHTYNLLKDKYDFVERGKIDVKGKGLMKTYFLKEKKS